MNPPEVLVLRALGLGDLLTAVPALRGLRRGFPEHRLVLATPGPLRVLAQPEVDEVLAHPGLHRPLPPRPVDVAVNLHGRGPASSLLLDALHPARRIGHAYGPPWDGPTWDGPTWQDAVAERARWCELLNWYAVPADPTDLRLPPPSHAAPLGAAPRPTVIHPGAGSPAKQWPPERFAAVARALAADGHHVVLTGSSAERGLATEVAARAGLAPAAVLAGSTSLIELARLVFAAAVVISGDTGVAHLATAYATPSVVLFGPVSARHWGPPPGGPHRTLSADRYRRGERFASTPDPALLAVSVPDVLAAACQVARTDCHQPEPRVRA